MTGPFPDRTPLNVRVTGCLDRSDYVMKQVLFESRPGFLVSANLYLPKGKAGRKPAVLNVIGHSTTGKARRKVQQRSIAQAKKGFVALTIDAIGQGERQVPEYESIGKAPSNAHRILGRQAFLAGTHLFNLMAWDAIRAVDYLVSRPDVDPDRIACTGCSGGGMMTTYLLPFEPRIAVAVPACNPCTWSHRVHAGLPNDHEQIFPGAFAAGFDPRGDPLFCHVPRPLLINATTDDNLNPPAGVWELSTWLERAYAAHQQPQRVKTTMVHAPHGYNLPQRELAYAWMLKWLGGDAGQFREGEFPIENEADTWCTRRGNVYADGRSKQPHELVLDHLRRHHPSWPPASGAEDLAIHKMRLRKQFHSVLGLPDQLSVPDVERRSVTTSAQLQITRIRLIPEEGIVLPAVWVASRDAPPQGPVIVYLHDHGKSQLAGNEIAERLIVDRGFGILAVDLRGIGETSPGMEDKFWDFLAGKPVFSRRVADVRSILAWLSHDEEVEGVFLWAQGGTALNAAIAAAIDGTASGLVLEDPLISFESIVRTRVPAYGEEVLVPAVLESFDMPQVYQTLCPTMITMINPLRGDKSPASENETNNLNKQVAGTGRRLCVPGNWRIVRPENDQQRIDEILSSFHRRER